MTATPANRAKTPQLHKHSSVIGIENRLALMQRKIYNVLLYFARPYLLSQDTHVLQVPTLERALGRTSDNRRYLIDSIEALNGLVVRYDVFARDRDNAHVWTEAAPILSGTRVTPDGSLVVYSFPQLMVPHLADPSRYGTLPLEIQNNVRGQYTLALWEFYLDQIGGRRNEAEIHIRLEDLRRLLCLEDRYAAFKDLRKRVLDPAHEEINEKTNISVHWIETLRRHRSVTAFRLKLTRHGSGTRAPAAIVQDGRPSDATRDPGLLHRLYDLFEQGAVNQIAGTYDAERIRRNLDYAARYPEARDRAALARAAIKDDYAGGSPDSGDLGRGSARAGAAVAPAAAAGDTAAHPDAGDRDRRTPDFAELPVADQTRLRDAFRRDWAVQLQGRRLAFPDDYDSHEATLFDEWLLEKGYRR